MAAPTSRKEEERNERIVRGLLKLPPNRRCINCNGIGPQYVCTSFWTFICISCSGIHREFAHRVKSVSMSKFTMEEVEALQKGGNQRAKEAFLKDFDTQQMRLPDSSNIGSLREFIRAVYVERRYAAVKFSERPPRDKQNQKAQEQECTRASSYHSFSQSPPYDYQYEERRNGKQPVMLSRKPGSDRGHDGKMSGFSYRSHNLHEGMSEDQFANESCGSRTSDWSGSSMSDTFRTTPESPNFLDNGCLNPPIRQNQSNIQNSNGITQSQRTASTGNVNSTYLKTGNSSLADLFFDSENVQGTRQSNNFVAPSFADFSGAVNGANENLFSQTVLQQQPVTGLKPSVDFFANMPCTTPPADKVPLTAPLTDDAGWATFDTPLEDKRPGLTGLSGVTTTCNDKQILSHDLFSFELNDKPTFFQTSKDNASVTNQSVTTSLDTSSSQFWHSFDDASGTMSNDPPNAQPVICEQKHVVNGSPTTRNPFTCLVAPKEFHDDGSHKLFMDGLAPDATLSAFAEPSLISNVHLLGGASDDQVPLNPFDLPFDDDSEAQDLFMDMSTLQAALPSPDLPTSFLDGLPETWFSNSTSTYVQSGSHGGSPCLVELLPNCPLRNITLSTVSSGNPFE